MEEELDKIRGVQQFIIPTKELKFFQELKYQLGELGFQVNDRRIVDNARACSHKVLDKQIKKW